ncbi:hypothetical protein [Streptomyces zagrosensis]|uniref:Uncharacterized protein n=1 Tax=Streptomyces zagrosensis TaxID=1042984 RepID=A0A7W9QGV3_9ACTN|nr:hypothetical protein [Streptomyces zagrosensis]MBB5938782.1 hypothetical protein [Streptomyces zagrosensis]
MAELHQRNAGQTVTPDLLLLGTNGRLWYPCRTHRGAWWPVGFARRTVTAVMSDLFDEEYNR